MTDPDDTVRIGVRVPLSLRCAAAAAADDAGMSLTAWVLEALLEHHARCEDGDRRLWDATPGKESPPPTSRRNR